MRSAFDVIRENPRSAAQLEYYTGPHEIRRQMLHRFPYAVVYLCRPDEIVVVAVAHTRRRPLHWLHRVDWRTLPFATAAPLSICLKPWLTRFGFKPVKQNAWVASPQLRFHPDDFKDRHFILFQGLPEMTWGKDESGREVLPGNPLHSTIFVE